MSEPGSSPSIQTFKGIALFLTAVVCFDLMGVMVRILSTDYSAPELSSYRNIFGIIPSLLLLLYRGELSLNPAAYKIRQWKLAMSRGISVAIAQFCLYTALAHMELATVAALSQTNAFIVVLLSIVLLGEQVGRWRWGALSLGFAGAVWILRPGSEAFSVYSLLPIAAAAGYAYSMVSVRKFDRSVSAELLYIHAAMASMAGAIALALYTTGFSPIQSWSDAGLIFLMANTGGVAVILMMLGFRAATPATLAPFTFFSLISAFALGWLFFDEAPVDKLFPGVILIVIAGAVIIWRENRRA